MKKMFVNVIFIMMMCSFLTVLFSEIVDADGTTIYVDGSGGADYTTIQEAVDAASSGDTVYVYSGTYNENVIIDRSITLSGQDKQSTIIDGGGGNSVITLEEDGVTIQGFTIRNSETSTLNNGGIRIESNSNVIQNNIISGNSNGIKLGKFTTSLSGNSILDNIIQSNVMNGIYLNYDASGGTISNNEINDNLGDGISIWSASNFLISNNELNENHGEGISVTWDSDSHTISNNQIINNNGNGIYFQSDCESNTVTENTIEGHSQAAIYILSSNNILYHNHLNNDYNAVDHGTNVWDNGYPSGGNYWSDYLMPDSDGDGIGDTVYDIPDGSNQDRYPLGIFNEFPTANAGGPYSVNVNIGVTFDGSGSTDSDGTIAGYRWDWTNDGTYDTSWLTSSTVTHSYSSVGTYTLKLEVKDDKGATDTDTTAVTVENNEPPTADPGSSYSSFIDTSITFDGSGSTDSDGTIAGYRWDWTNDGTYDTSWLTSSTVTHSYSSVGTYTLKLEVKDDKGATDTATTIVTILEQTSESEENIIPAAEAGDSYSGVVNISITLDGSGSWDTDGTIVSYNWDFGDGHSGTGVYASHTYADIGDYTITLTVTDDDGATNIDTTTATIIEESDQNNDPGTNNSNDTGETSKTPGFKLLIAIFAIAVFIFLKRKRIGH